MSATHIVLIAFCATTVFLALIGAWMFQNIYKSEAKQDTPATTPTAPAASSETKADGKAAKAADKPAEAAKPAKAADKPKWKHGSIVGDVIWITVGLAFINWFWAKTFNQSWQMLWTHDSFWATQIGIMVVAVGFKNAKNSIVKGLCFVILVMTVISAVKIVLPTFNKSETKTPVVMKPQTHVEYTSPGTWSRKFVGTEVVRITLVGDRVWRVCLRDPLTKEEVIKEELMTLKHIEVPWNALWFQVSSASQALEIEVKDQF